MSSEETKEVREPRDLVTELNGVLQKTDKYLEFGVVDRHSFYQLNHFIVNKEPTVQSKMWQCMRELNKRRDDLESINLEIEETHDNLELLDIQVQRNATPPEGEEKFAKKERAIHTRQVERRKISLSKSLNRLEKRLTEVMEESKYFLKALDTLQNIEPLQPFDNPQTQREYWNQRLTEELNLRMALNIPVDLELAKCIFALHDEAPIKQQLLNIIDQQQKLQGEEMKKLIEGAKEEDDDNDDQEE